MINNIKLPLTFWGFFLFFLVSNNKAIGQITPDRTVPTAVQRSGNTTEITGGSTAGNNLFHSFEEFSISTGQSAFFNNADNIINIFSRVTGNSISQIDGLIRANSNANLFLLNPNGIIFGKNSSLDIGGSFLATTAQSIIFRDGAIFDTQNPQNPLLTIDIPIGLQIGANLGSIINRSTTQNNDETVGLEVNRGQDITFLGGDITFNGGNLTAPGGQVNLAGLSSAGLVEFDENENLNFSSKALLSNILLDNSATVNVRADNGGSVAINANNLSLKSESLVLAGIKEGLGTIESQAGNIDVNVTNTIGIVGSSDLSNSIREEAVGKGGDINITTKSLFLNNNAEIAALSNGQGDAGNIKVEALDSVSLNGGSKLRTAAFGFGDAGDVTIEAINGSVSFRGANSGIVTIVGKNAVGQGGNIFINANELLITKEQPNNLGNVVSPDPIGALLRTSTLGKGNAGDIVIRIDDSFVLSGSDSLLGGLRSIVDQGAVGEGGNIDISANSFSIVDGGSINTSSLGEGNAGNIKIEAADSIVILGTAPFEISEDNPIGSLGSSSGIISNTDDEARGTGGQIDIDAPYLRLSDGGVISSRSRSNFDSGDITINAQTLEVIDGGQILTSAFKQGSAGNIDLNISDRVTVSGSDLTWHDRFGRAAAIFGREEAEFLIDPVSPESGIYANTNARATGNGANINLNTDELSVNNKARISVSSSGRGNSGSLRIESNTIDLGDGAKLFARVNTGELGNIVLDTDALKLSNGSIISTNAQSTDGGNISIDTDILVALEDSDITANAERGRGGRVTIDAKGIFGIKSRNFATSQSDITASSELGLQFNGIVDINTPAFNSIEKLRELPTDLVSSEPLQSCQAQKAQNNSTFTNIGRGGMPSNPDELNNSEVWEDLRSLGKDINNSSLSKIDNVNIEPEQNQPEQIVEAKGWIVNSKGNVVLTVQPTNTSSHKNQNYSTICFVLQ